MFSEATKLKVQRFGRFLSNMVMPNIGAFIAWGLITALFIPTGWLPNESLGKLVGPMITYLLPLLIGYTGGKIVGGDRGAVVGAITTMGVIVGTDIPMFLGAMIVGPLGGWAIKSFDRAVEGKIKSGFEMLVNNFSAGIIGMLLALLAFVVIGPAVKGLSGALAAGVDFAVHAQPVQTQQHHCLQTAEKDYQSRELRYYPYSHADGQRGNAAGCQKGS